MGFSSPLSSTRNIVASKKRAQVSAEKVKNPALGAYEAACLMGVHWTRAPKMAANGEIATRELSWSSDDHRLRVYSMLSANANWHAYEDLLASGGHRRRPRANAHLRAPMLGELGKIEQHIEFADAVSANEASEILGCYHSALARMVEGGRLVGRILISHREGPSRTWIFSRRSCEENVAQYLKSSSAGRPRTGL